MSWLDSPPKRNSARSKVKEVIASTAAEAWGIKVTSATRTYGSSKRRPGASSAVRGNSGGRSQFVAGGPLSASVGVLSSLYEDEAKSPTALGSAASWRSPTLESSPSALTFTANRGVEVDLDDSPINPVTTTTVSKTTKKASSKASGGKAAKPKATATKSSSTSVKNSASGGASSSTAAAATSRTNRTNSRTRKQAVGAAAISGGEQSIPAGAIEAPADSATTAPKRKGTTAAGRKPRATRNSATSSTRRVIDLTANEQPIADLPAAGSTALHLSPKNRRDRSPSRRARGRPDRGADRGTSGSGGRKPPAPAITSPLQSITNNSDEGARGSRGRRGKVKSGAASITAKAEEALAMGDTSGSRKSNSSSSEEEEWRDDFDFSAKETDGKDLSRPWRARGGGGNRLGGAATTESRLQQRRDSVEKFGIGEAEDAFGSIDPLMMSPRQVLTPSACTPEASREPPVSLDSSIDGILVGDKRRRGKGRGKRGARTVEENAHRSSRSRHLSPMIPVSAAGSNYHGIAVGEEQDELPDAVSDAFGLDDVDSPRRSDQMNNTTAQHEGYKNALLLSYDIESPTGAPPPEVMRDHRRITSAAPAISMTHSPHLFGGRTAKRASSIWPHASSPSTVSVSTYPTDKEPSKVLSSSGRSSAKAGGASRQLEEWYAGDSPPARLSRSLSQASGATAWSGSTGGGSGAGCAKVTRAAFRRRSRANSVSSMMPMPMPMPVLETSSSFDSNHRVVAEATAGGSSSSWSQSCGVGLSSLGSSSGGGGMRKHPASIKRNSFSSLSGRFFGSNGSASGADGDDETTAGDGSADPMRVSRSRTHLPSEWIDAGAAQGAALPVARDLHDRPMSLPKGVSMGALGDAATESLAGEAAVGWVLRAPGTTTSFGRHRSNSFAGGRKGYLQARHLRSASLSAPGVGGSPSSWQRQVSSCSDRQEANEEEGGGDLEGGRQRLRSASCLPDMVQVAKTAKTPQTSPTHSNNAARHRSNNLSSVARRMDRLEIRSPDVDTQAAQAQKAILGSPIHDEGNAGTLLTAVPQGSMMVLGSGDASTPVRPGSIPLPLHVTPIWGSTTNRDRMSRSSGGVGSPSECLRDYSSGERRDENSFLGKEKTSVDVAAAASGENNTEGTLATPSMTSEQQKQQQQQERADMISPPAGITFTRSTAVGLPTPLVADLFPSSDGESSSSSSAAAARRNDRRKKPNKASSRGAAIDSFTPELVATRNDVSSSSVAESNGQSEESAQRRPNLDRSARMDRLAELWGSGRKGSGSRGGKGQTLTRHKTWSPPQPRKGSKLGAGPRSRTMPLSSADDTPGIAGAVEDGPDGFFIRRKSLMSSVSSSPPLAWATGCGDDHVEASAAPTTLRRIGVNRAASSSSMYPSCLSAGGDMESPCRPSDEKNTRRRRSISSPLPLPADTEGSACDTPGAFLTVGGFPASGVREDYDGGGALEPSSADRGIDLVEHSTCGSGGLTGGSSLQRHEMRSPEIGSMLDVSAAPALSLMDGNGSVNPRRTSTESIGVHMTTSSRAIFETPQAEAKFKWGSQPQYGDWGISQPASARSLTRLKGRLKACAGRATGGKSGCGSADSEQALPAADGASPCSFAATPQRYQYHHSCNNNGVDSATKSALHQHQRMSPMDDTLRILPYRGCCPGSASSCSSSVRDRSSFGMNLRSSLGTLAEREEVVAAGESPEDVGDSEEAGDGERGEGGGIEVVGGGSGVDLRGNEWDAASGSAIREKGRSRLSGLMMTERQREAQRRKQSKAKIRRVSMSIKSRHGNAGMATGGMSALGLMDMSSPSQVGVAAGMGVSNKQRRRTSFGHRMMVENGLRVGGKGGQGVLLGFDVSGGGVICEGQKGDEKNDEDESKEESREGATTPLAKASARWGASPMSTEKHAWAEDERGDTLAPLEDGKGDTPAKVREDLEKSMTELTNLSISMYNSESDGSPTKRGANTPSKEFLLSPTDDLCEEALSLPHSDSCENVESNAGVGVPVSPVEALQRQGAVAKALSMLSAEELLGETAVVCRGWMKAASLAFAEVASQLEETDEDGQLSTTRIGRSGTKQPACAPVSSRSRWLPEKVASTFPWGAFLSEGSFKQVFKVWNSVQSRMEALSVMDCQVIAETDSQEVILQEQKVSILTSSLVQRRICPNFVQTFGLFRCCAPPSPEVFGTADKKYPLGRSPGILRTRPRRALLQGCYASCAKDCNLRYQFIGMELCGHGDAEGLIRNQPDGLLSLSEAHCFLFQMAFALYVGRTELSMRHFDVKLLNFLVADAAALLGGVSGSEGAAGTPAEPGDLSSLGDEQLLGMEDGGGVVLRYAVGAEVVELRMPEERAFVVKLADFGTADVDPLSVGQPVEAGHFTTLENTPMEQLCCGSDAQQDYASDTFALALAVVHLFTGEAPYEEIMEEVECPDDLYDALANTWSEEKHSQYSVLSDIILDDDDATLFNTFYRYLVLFGVPDRSTLEEAFGVDNPVWTAVGVLLGWKANRARGRRAAGLSAMSKRFCRKLREDQARFSLVKGTYPAIARGRARLQALPGAMELVQAMGSFCPADRPTMLEVLTHEVFAGIRAGVDDAKVGAEAGERLGGKVLDFMAFLRREGDNRPLVDV